MIRVTSLFKIVLILFSYSIFSQNCITINQHPQNQITVDNDDIILTVNATSVENLQYQWQRFNRATNTWDNILDGDDYSGTNTDTLTITNVKPSIDRSLFRVVVSNQNNACTIVESDEATITYVIIRVNNIFTPNDDGFNDFFTIRGLTNFRNNKLKIYNRWGNLVYKKTNYQNDWDGVATSGLSVNGSKKVPSGTYFYTIDLNFDNKKLSGWLYINR